MRVIFETEAKGRDDLAQTDLFMRFPNFIPFFALQLQILRAFLPLFIIDVRDWSFSYERNRDVLCDR